jgi:hypothetical protein
MRPRRTSVALWTDGRFRVFVEEGMKGIINSRWPLVVGSLSLSLANQIVARCSIRERLKTNDRGYAGVTRILISTAVDECVSAPTEMKSTPVSA